MMLWIQLRRSRLGRLGRRWALAVGLTLTALGPAQADKSLQVVFGVSRPPFVDEHQQSGISVELFREAARRAGYTYTAQHAPNRRMVRLLAEGLVDAAVEVPADNPALLYSAPFVSYRNVVAWPRTMPLKFSGWGDLIGRSVCTWQLADQTLGPAFAEARKRFGQYQEFGAQRDQVRLWLLGRCGVLIIDQTLLKWHLQRLKQEEPSLAQPSAADIQMAPVPGGAELHWFVGFRSAELRDRFDAALRSMRDDGRYDAIVNQQLGLSGP